MKPPTGSESGPTFITEEVQSARRPVTAQRFQQEPVIGGCCYCCVTLAFKEGDGPYWDSSKMQSG